MFQVDEADSFMIHVYNYLGWSIEVKREFQLILFTLPRGDIISLAS